MCNIAYVKVINSSSNYLLLKNNNNLLKYYIFNIKCTSFNTNLLLYFKLLNMYKFAHDKKI
jgi:hypothetical protein